MSLKEIYQNVTSEVWENINDTGFQSVSTSEEKAIIIMYLILIYVGHILNVNIPINLNTENIRNLRKSEKTNFKKLFLSLLNKRKFNASIKMSSIVKKLTQYDTLENVVKDIILNVIKSYNLPVDNIEDVNKYVDLDDVIFEQEGGLKEKERTGPIDLFTNSELVQDNITELNNLIEKINKELYNSLRSSPEGEFFNPDNVIKGIGSVQDLFDRLLQLAGGDEKLISDKFDIIVDYLSKDTTNPAGDMDTYFRIGVFPLKKVNISDPNKPSKNANLITGTQNIYKVENTQNPFKISPYVNNDLGDYVVNGKKINIKLVGLNYIVKEGTKTKVFKNLSLAKQFIYNGGFDMYNNNKSKFINNVSKDFNNKKQPLRLSYSSNIF